MAHDWQLIRTALAYAVDANEDTVRKGSGAPYVSHLWSVAALVWEHGGSDVQVAVALLHDMAEDHGGEDALAEMRRRLPQHPEIPAMVAELSDTLVDDPRRKPPWLPRKLGHLEQLDSASPEVLLVAAADKLHNARCTIADYRRLGDALWERFRAPRGHVLWFQQRLVDLLCTRLPGDLSDELARTVGELVDLVAADVAGLGDELARAGREAVALGGAYEAAASASGPGRPGR